jgi:CheY-like chemotaxis protein
LARPIPPESAAPLLLIADDDNIFRTLLAAALADEGYPLAEARDGLEALAALEQSPVPMVALCDYRMPGLDGLQVLRAITFGPPTLRRHQFILMTANIQQLPAAEWRLLRQRHVPLLSKPFKLAALLEIVAAAVDQIARHD